MADLNYYLLSNLRKKNTVIIQVVQSFRNARINHPDHAIIEKIKPGLRAFTERLSFDNELNKDKTVYSKLNCAKYPE